MILRPPSRRVSQGEADCVAACCAMAAGESLESAHRWARTEPGSPWTDALAAAFLLSRGIYAGAVLRPEARGASSAISFLFEYEMSHAPCMLSVRGPSDWHMVYWCDGLVWDPSPRSEWPASRWSAPISEIWPLHEIDARGLDQLRDSAIFARR